MQGEVAIQDGTFNKKYAGSDNWEKVAWFGACLGGSKTEDVGTKKPNQLGLYDCCGNIQEWCYDIYGKYNIDINKEYRILRGGFVDNYSEYCNVCRGGWDNSTIKKQGNGFRIVRTI